MADIPEAVRAKLQPGLALLTLSVVLIVRPPNEFLNLTGWVILVLGAVVETLVR